MVMATEMVMVLNKVVMVMVVTVAMEAMGATVVNGKIFN
jgi:hypothetical protein